jgi:hypothetical protein
MASLAGSLPQHLLPPTSSLHRSSPALDSSTTVCSPPTTLPRTAVGAPTPRIEQCYAAQSREASHGAPLR